MEGWGLLIRLSFLFGRFRERSFSQLRLVLNPEGKLPPILFAIQYREASSREIIPSR